MTKHRRVALISVATGFALMLLLACAGGSITPTTAESPNWACPSPTPRPYGTAGPIKEIARTPIPTVFPEGPELYNEEAIYYEAWEQEYSSLASGPVYPTPTPYAVVGTNYAFGQRVRVSPLYVLISAHADRLLDAGQQLYYIDITWNNPTSGMIPIDYVRQLNLRSITVANGQVRSGDGWRLSTDALALAGLEAPVSQISPGETRLQVPVIAPAGTPQVVELVVERTSVETGNADLRNTSAQHITVQWSNAALMIGPPCQEAGAMTLWQTSSGITWGHESGAVAAPPGADRVVQLALNQVGKRYIWGAEGPETFDCSGLMQWSYSQLSIRIPRTANEQRLGLRAISARELQPGDLVFFAPPGGTRMTHVAMFIGDYDGDGTGDIVHAANPDLGVRVTPHIFNSRYYSGGTCELCIAGFATAR